MSVQEVLYIIQKHPEGVWVRQIAREAGVSPATVCNYLYGYKDRKGKKVKAALRDQVEISKIANGAVTMIKPKTR
jgi:predicted transcriptional regulator